MASRTRPDATAKRCCRVQTFLVLLALSVIGACSAEQPPATTGAQVHDTERLPADQAADYQKRAYFAREYADAIDAVDPSTVKELKSGPQIAWYTLNLGRAGNDHEALATAAHTSKQQSTNEWSEFAMAGALLWSEQRGIDALVHAESAYSQQRHNVDFIWLYAETLRLQHQFDAALGILEADRALLDSTPQLLVVWASALYDQVLRDPRATSLVRRADAALERARALDKTSVDVLFTSGWFQLNTGRIAGGIDALRAAASLSSSESVHGAYWRAVLDRRDQSYETRKAAILADVEALLQRNHSDVRSQTIAAQGYRMLGDEKKAEEIERHLIQTGHTSRDTDFVEFRSLLDSFSARGSDAEGNEASVAQLGKEMRREIEEFLQRSPRDPEVTRSGRRILFTLALDDRSIAATDFLAMANAVSAYEEEDPRSAYVDVPLALADRHIALDRAEELARKGVRLEEARLKYLRKHGWDYQDEYTNAATFFDALGWVLLQQGRLHDAEVEFRRAALANDFGANQVFIHHMAQFHLKRGDHTNARALITRCYLADPDPRIRCRDDVRAYYLALNHTLGRLEASIESFEKEVRDVKVDRLTGEMRDARTLLPSFRLRTLDGHEWASESLRGKTAVIAFWGLWCALCGLEMPEIQKFYSKHSTDADITLVTINTDEDPEVARAYVSAKKFTFPVLIDDGYAKRSQMDVFPTTWIVDFSGRVAFEIKGVTQDIGEEIGLRIELLRRERMAPDR